MTSTSRSCSRSPARSSTPDPRTRRDSGWTHEGRGRFGVRGPRRRRAHEKYLANAPGASDKLREVAAEIATTIASELGVTGALAVELFETTDDRLLVNELAMRPHNSGHWSIDGSATSQFEQHLRAVLDLPLGPTAPRDP